MPKILEKCIAEVMAKGHDESSAWAICGAALGMSQTKEEDDISKLAAGLSDKVKDGSVKLAVPETKMIGGVEIFAEGTWNGDTYTVKDLDDMVAAFDATKDKIRPYLKLGHDDGQKMAPQEDGMPAMGWIENVRRVGKKLVADFKNVPKKIYDLIAAGGYRRVSAEIFLNLKVGGKTWPKLLKAVSLLGGDTPAVQTLDDILSLYASKSEVNAYGIDAETRTYDVEFNKTNKEDSKVTIEELQKQLAEDQKNLSEATAKIVELTKENEGLKKDAETAKAEIAKLSEQTQKLAAEKNKAKVEADVTKLIQDKRILPAQKADAVAMLSEAIVSTKTYKEGDKELSEYDKMVAFMSKGKVDVSTEEETEAGKRQIDPNDLDAKTNEYIANMKKEGKIVSYKEALIAVSPEKTEPAEEKAE